jgi:hypothetical protein
VAPPQGPVEEFALFLRGDTAGGHCAAFETLSTIVKSKRVGRREGLPEAANVVGIFENQSNPRPSPVRCPGAQQDS